MRKSQELEDPKSCLNRARPDEPLMVLRAHDESAARLTRQWATGRLAAIRAGRKPPEDIAAVHEALQLADEMDSWREQEQTQKAAAD